MIWVILVCLLMTGAAATRITQLQREVRHAEQANHAECIAHIASVTSRHFAAQVVRELAEKWDGIDNQVAMAQARREFILDDTRTVPAIWLLHEAERLEQS